MSNAIEQIKEQASISELIPHLCKSKVAPDGTNRYVVSPCPFCNHNDSFKIWHKDKGWKCFSCNETGSAIDLVMKIRNYEIKEALEWLANFYNITFNPSDKKKNPNQLTPYTKQEIWRKATEHYHKALFSKEAKPVLKFLTEKRGYSIEILKEEKIGFTSGKLTKFLTTECKYDAKLASKTGLIHFKEKNDHENYGYYVDYFYYGGVIFPHRRRDKILSFSFKPVMNREGKIIYKKKIDGRTFNPYPLKNIYNETEWFGYGMDAIDDPSEEPVLLVEGEWEYLTLKEKGKHPKTFCICGNRSNELTLKKLTNANQTYITGFDHDNAGKKYTDHFGSKLIEADRRVAILPFPEEYNDPDEWLNNCDNPTKEFKEAIITPQRFIYSGDDGTPDPITGIYKSHGCYRFKDPRKKEDAIPYKISNFTIDFPRQYVQEIDGEIVVEREFILKNTNGEISPPAIIRGKDMNTVKGFQRWLYDRGYFVMTQSDDKILSNLSQYLHNKEARKTVIIKKQVGYMAEENIFVLGNGMMNSAGRFIPADSNGISWQNKLKGYKPFVQDASQVLPTIEKGLSREEYLDLQALATETISQNLGTKSAALAIAWLKASLFSDIIHKEFNKFPILFLYGASKSGKNYLMENLIGKMLGYDKIPATNLADSTIPQLYKKMEFYSNQVVLCDEHTTNKIETKRKVEGYYASFKDIYQKIGRTIAIDAGIRTKTNLIRATLALMGENLPTEPSVRNRCVIIILNAKGRNDELKPILDKMAPNFRFFLYHWLQDRMNPEYCEKMLLRIHQAIYRFKKIGITGREAENYAIVGAFAEEIYEHVGQTELKEFQDFLLTEATDKFERIEAESIINQFNNDLEVIIAQKKDYIPLYYFKIFSDEPNILYFWGMGVYKGWLSYQRKEFNNYNLTLSFNEWKDLLKETDYYINQPPKPKTFAGGVKRQKALALNIDKLPESYHNILEEYQNFGIAMPAQEKINF